MSGTEGAYVNARLALLPSGSVLPVVLGVSGHLDVLIRVESLEDGEGLCSVLVAGHQPDVNPVEILKEISEILSEMATKPPTEGAAYCPDCGGTHLPVSSDEPKKPNGA